jgi:hypothetical protein
MRTVIVWWDLSESAQTIESLRTYLLGESVAAAIDFTIKHFRPLSPCARSHTIMPETLT